jgi:DNA-binding transcriptional LysR family regulator
VPRGAQNAQGLLNAVPPHRRAGATRQRLRVTTPPTFARQILVAHLQADTSAHPQVELEALLSIPCLTHGACESDVEVRNGAAADRPRLMRDVVLPVARCLTRLCERRCAHAPTLVSGSG